MLDVARDPRWGRGVEETFGEDPTLVSQFGTAYIQGLRGGSLQWCHGNQENILSVIPFRSAE